MNFRTKNLQGFPAQYSRKSEDTSSRVSAFCTSPPPLFTFFDRNFKLCFMQFCWKNILVVKMKNSKEFSRFCRVHVTLKNASTRKSWILSIVAVCGRQTRDGFLIFKLKIPYSSQNIILKKIASLFFRHVSLSQIQVEFSILKNSTTK